MAHEDGGACMEFRIVSGGSSDGTETAMAAGEVLVNITALRFQQDGAEETLANEKFLVWRDRLLSEDQSCRIILQMFQNTLPLITWIGDDDRDGIHETTREVLASEHHAFLYVYAIGNENPTRYLLVFFGETEARGLSNHSGAIRMLVEMLRQVREVKAGDSGDQSLCAICLGQFSDDDSVSALPCSHVYHRRCVLRWLVKSNLCPLCRRTLT